MPALPDLGFLAPHSGIEILGPHSVKGCHCPVLKIRMVSFDKTLVPSGQELHQLAPTHIPVDIADHS